MYDHSLFSKKEFVKVFAAIYACSTVMSFMCPAAVSAETMEDVAVISEDETVTEESDAIVEASLEETDMTVETVAEDAEISAEEAAAEETDEAEEINPTEEETVSEETDEAGEEDLSEESSTITFDGSTVNTGNADGVTIAPDDKTGLVCVTLSQGGEYTLTGSGENIYVSVTTTDSVSLTLSSLSITNRTDCDASFIEAVKKAKLTVTLEGENTVTGGNGAMSLKKNSSLKLTGSGSLTVTGAADDGIKSKGDIVIDTCSIVIDRCGGDGIQGENITVNSGNIDITTYYQNATTGYYTKGNTSVDGYNTIWESGSTKTERVNVDTGSHKGIKAGTKAKTITFTQGDDDGSLGAEESSVASGGLYINGGTITIDTTGCGLKANSVTSGGYTATSTGVYIIGSPDDGLSSNNELVINGGTINIASSDDGISSMGKLLVKGSATVDIETAYEGMEGAEVVIGEEGKDGPQISIVSNDDGINTSQKTLTYVYDSYSGYESDEDTGYYKKSVSAQSGSNCNIYSGSVTIKIDSETTHAVVLSGSSGSKTISYKSSGDGIDCNGSLDIEGGTVLVFGQTSGDNSPIDTNTGFTLGNKATVLGTGTDGMNESKPEAGDGVYITLGSQGMGGMPGSGRGSTSGSSSYQAGSKLVVSDGTNEIINTTLPCSASFLVFASPLLTSGSTYTVSIGNTSETVTAYAAGSQSTAGSGNGQEPLEMPGGEEGQEPPEIPGGEDGQQILPPSGTVGETGTAGSANAATENITVLPVKDKSLNVADKLTPRNAAKVRYVVSGNAVKVTKKGQVKAKKAGEAVIKSQVKIDGKWVDTGLSCKIRVEAPVVTKKKVLKVGESISVNDLIDSSSTTLSPVNYYSTKSSVATVDEDGKITAVKKGKCRIKIRIGAVIYKTVIQVTE